MGALRSVTRIGGARLGRTRWTLYVAVALVALLGVWRRTSARGRVVRAAWPLGLEFDRPPVGRVPVVSAGVVALGERLFFDTRFSKDRTLSCASCHDPEASFAGVEARAVGLGGHVGRRNAPAVFNRLLGASQFWDGRADRLQDQVLGPLYDPGEMGMDEALVLERLGEAGYPRAFQRAFGESPSIELFVEAVAVFEMTLVSAGSAFDAFEWNGDRDALSASAQRGLDLFRGKGRCTLCHTGTNLTDEDYHDVGIGVDEGRFQVSGREEDRRRFKTPTLRNVALTAPYMHDGSMATLEDVIEHYDRGGESELSELVPLGLEEVEKEDLIAFLQALTAPVVSVRPQDLEERLAAFR